MSPPTRNCPDAAASGVVSIVIVLPCRNRRYGDRSMPSQVRAARDSTRRRVEPICYRSGSKIVLQGPPHAVVATDRPASPSSLLLALCIASAAAGRFAVRRPALAPARPVPRRARADGRAACRASRSISISARSTAASGKRIDAGRTWQPIFDDAAGRLDRRARDRAVGPERHLRRHRRSRHALGHRAGRRHVPLADARQDVDARSASPTASRSAAILVDPRDANTVFVAALGHPYGPNAERGVFRSRDGGATLAARARQGRRHRRDRPRVRARQSAR